MENKTSPTERQGVPGVEEEASINIIETVKDLDLYSAVKLKEEFESLISRGYTRFIINMKETRYIDSSGLGALIKMHQYTLGGPERIMILVNVNSSILQVIRLTRLEQMFKIFPNLEEAVKEIQGTSPGKTTLSPQPPAAVEEIPQKDNAEGWEKIEKDKEFYQRRPLQVDQSSHLLNKSGLEYVEFYSVPKEIDRGSILLAARLCSRARLIHTLEQQIHIFLENALIHGNKKRKSKKIKVWYGIEQDIIRLIIEDEGKGFLKLEEWNEFYEKRTSFLLEELQYKGDSFASFPGSKGRGKALFSAVEFWNNGIVFNQKRNGVALARRIHLPPG